MFPNCSYNATPEASLHCQKGGNDGMMTPKNKDTGVWNMLSPCLDTIQGKLNHSQGTGPDSGIRGLLSHWSMAG